MRTCVCVRERVDERETTNKREMPDSMCYGVATDSEIDKIIGLFCRIASL